jgi:short-subunit dehydrogenase
MYGMFGATIHGPMFMCKHAINVFLGQGGGVIINGSSGQSLRGDNHGPAYAAAKAAMNSLTRSIAVQYGKQNIRANTIATGIIQTALMKQVIPPDMAELYRSHVLTPDLGDPIDIAEAVVFLASDRSRYITGQTVQVDGGILDQTPYVAMLRTLAEDQQHLQASDAARIFGFDLDALTPIAERVGPTVEELSTPLPKDEIPPFALGDAFQPHRIGS